MFLNKAGLHHLKQVQQIGYSSTDATFNIYNNTFVCQTNVNVHTVCLHAYFMRYSIAT